MVSYFYYAVNRNIKTANINVEMVQDKAYNESFCHCLCDYKSFARLCVCVCVYFLSVYYTYKCVLNIFVAAGGSSMLFSLNPGLAAWGLC